jgi:hypothetical protein
MNPPKQLALFRVGATGLSGPVPVVFSHDGADRYIVKILECRALDANGVVQKSLVGG